MDMTPEESWKAFTATGSIEAYLAYRSLTDRELPLQDEDNEQDFDNQTSNTNHIFYI